MFHTMNCHIDVSMLLVTEIDFARSEQTWPESQAKEGATTFNSEQRSNQISKDSRSTIRPRKIRTLHPSMLHMRERRPRARGPQMPDTCTQYLGSHEIQIGDNVRDNL